MTGFCTCQQNNLYLTLFDATGLPSCIACNQEIINGWCACPNSLPPSDWTQNSNCLISCNETQLYTWYGQCINCPNQYNSLLSYQTCACPLNLSFNQVINQCTIFCNQGYFEYDNLCLPCPFSSYHYQQNPQQCNCATISGATNLTLIFEIFNNTGFCNCIYPYFLNMFAGIASCIPCNLQNNFVLINNANQCVCQSLSVWYLSQTCSVFCDSSEYYTWYGGCQRCPSSQSQPINNICVCPNFQVFNTVVNQCVCAKGYFDNETNGNNTCSSCGYGTYQSMIGQSFCLNCKIGSYSNISSQFCINCPAGTYGTIIKQSLSSSCFSCNIGTYNQLSGQSSCLNCSGGTYTSIMGFSYCITCQQGAYIAVSGSSFCQNCNNYSNQCVMICNNTYFIYQSYCLPCPFQTTVLGSNSSSCNCSFNNLTLQFTVANLTGFCLCPQQNYFLTTVNKNAICVQCSANLIDNYCICPNQPNDWTQNPNCTVNCSLTQFFTWYGQCSQCPNNLRATQNFSTCICPGEQIFNSSLKTCNISCSISQFILQQYCIQCPLGTYQSLSNALACNCDSLLKNLIFIVENNSGFCKCQENEQFFTLSDTIGQQSCIICNKIVLNGWCACPNSLPPSDWTQNSNCLISCNETQLYTWYGQCINCYNEMQSFNNFQTCLCSLGQTYIQEINQCNYVCEQTLFLNNNQCWPCPLNSQQLYQTSCDCSTINGASNLNLTFIIGDGMWLVLGSCFCQPYNQTLFLNMQGGIASCIPCTQNISKGWGMNNSWGKNNSYNFCTCSQSGIAWIRNPSCIIGCAANQYLMEFQGNQGYATYEYCIQCPQNSNLVAQSCVCPQGQTYKPFINACACSTGWIGYIVNQTTGVSFCLPCQAGTYQSMSGQTLCLNCSAGTYNSVQGASGCTSCQQGTYSSSIGSAIKSCINCSMGTYSSLQNATFVSSCQNCSSGMYNTISGASLSSACIQCQAGSYNTITGATSNKNCILCSVGTFSTKSGASTSSTCTQCTTGQYQNQSGMTICSSCPEGNYQTQVGESQCTNCTAGTYSSINGSSSSQTCLRCQVGTYSSVFGASSNAMCTRCSSGTYSNTLGASMSTLCIMCAIGQYQGQSGMSMCTTCQMGQYQSHSGQSACINCSVGTYNMLLGANSSSQCLQCQVGTYSTFQSSSQCTQCRMGTYNTNIGASLNNSCILCSAGTFSTQSGASTSYTCIQCAVGFYQSKSGMTTCTNCSVGNYQTQIGESSCTNCTVGTYQSMQGLSFCILCSTGTFAQAVGNSKCVSCQTGNYSSLLGQSQCIKCKIGTYQSQIGQQACNNCSIGQYQSLEGQTNCVSCLYGQYQSQSQQSLCSNCSAGMFSSQFGQTQCQNCSIGSYCSIVASSQCYRCSVNTYQNISAQTQCLNCTQYNYSTGNFCYCLAPNIVAGNGLCVPCGDNSTYENITPPTCICKDSNAFYSIQFNNCSCKQNLVMLSNNTCTSCPNNSKFINSTCYCLLYAQIFNFSQGICLCNSSSFLYNEICLLCPPDIEANVSYCECPTFTNFTIIGEVVYCICGGNKSFINSNCQPCTYNYNQSTSICTCTNSSNNWYFNQSCQSSPMCNQFQYITQYGYCNNCPDNNSSINDYTTCPCPNGQVFNQPLYSCSCTYGWFDISNLSNQSIQCSQCQAGTYQSIIGSSTCQQCPNGTIGTQIGAISSQVCQVPKKQLSSGAIAGIVIGSIVATILIIIFVIWICNYIRRKRDMLIDAPTNLYV